MIGKIVKGKSFKGCISYVLNPKDAELLLSEGVLTTDTKSITNSFYMQSLMNPNLAKCVGHISLSYSKEDTSLLTNKMMVQLAKEYMQAMKIENTQFIVIRHNNTDNPHCHIVFNRIDNEGKTISDKNDRYRNEKICKQIKDKYRLTYGQGKDRTNIQKLKGAEQTKYEIYKAIKTSLSMARNWQQFEHILNIQGISIAYKHKGQTNEIQGISFKKGQHSFKGSDVDRSFSYSKLNNQLIEKNRLDNNSQSARQVQPEQKGASIVESVIDGLAGASFIETGSGEDFQENAFRERMEYEEQKRKKKKKRRGGGL
ncbi:hypothetical protein M2451_003506 [Dysgonomonas sp. PFB1-18]|uniref:relaxase/mobilization nuclease domain-containing protein n=1 Tax=unclassified Dysgonomonas TaxID=2630389 RepID=UPI002474F375|nr:MULTISPECIES: relaxase/mobilization nuclease domain-containing protein [unclassified Dysgonomonas]MDH6310727.1 hypothetical protein [Dysgonomonas sp. PF1-14]MDH6340577.1 hypothetical protein [Dysgonomonas sp. PF1-16]MDH6382166.1 hypothetical protein [Dysgonomonas sp. PFB1-18]MDH6399510.1 hypothetical protein [Dysgonomonas sp. PF1-23]